MNASLGAAAYAALKQAVLDASLAPGSTASEPEIAARLGMSRTPVHEAVLRLQSEGFLRVIPKRGVLVVPVARADVADVYEVLIALEGAAAARLARAPAALHELRALTAEMEQALHENRRRAWAEADDAFHRLLLRACGNTRLEAGAANALDLAGRARLVTLAARPLAASAAEHWALIEALDSGDAAGAQSILAEHRSRAAREMLALLA
jgi:DNA-binding GntR family transcriptional regulator